MFDTMPTYQLEMLQLFQENGKRQTFIPEVDPDDCIISRFNTRKTRSAEDVEALAQRMRRNGYEITRALWACKNGHGQYEVFAGGTRLEAARLARVRPALVLFEGYSDQEISRKSDEDNENDEYHRPVSIVDVWAEYARLRDEEGWTQQMIAEAKGVSQALVSERLALNDLPAKVKQFITQDALTEAHLREIRRLSLELYFSPWLTTEQAWQELAEKAVADKKKNGAKSVRAVRADVDAWKAWIATATGFYETLPAQEDLYELQGQNLAQTTWSPREALMNQLSGTQARSMAAVQQAIAHIAGRRATSARLREAWLKQENQAIFAAEQQALLVQALERRFLSGDCRQMIQDLADGSVRLVLTDPPFGKDYQSNRRWASAPPPLMEGDESPEVACQLLREALELLKPKLADEAHVLIFCQWRNEPDVQSLLEEIGLTLRGSLVWVKEEHSAGDVQGTFAPRHERIVHATRGHPAVTPRIPDVLEFHRVSDPLHPAQKPEDLLRALIRSTTAERQLVVDPFAGVASTLVASAIEKRLFWGAESALAYWQRGQERLLALLDHLHDTLI